MKTLIALAPLVIILAFALWPARGFAYPALASNDPQLILLDIGCDSNPLGLAISVNFVVVHPPAGIADYGQVNYVMNSLARVAKFNGTSGGVIHYHEYVTDHLAPDGVYDVSFGQVTLLTPNGALTLMLFNPKTVALECGVTPSWTPSPTATKMLAATATYTPTKTATPASMATNTATKTPLNTQTPTATPTETYSGKCVKSARAGVGGKIIIYTIKVTNTGKTIADDFLLYDPLPSAVKYSDSKPSQGRVSISGRLVTWKIGDLFPQRSAVLKIITKHETDTRVFKNTAFVKELDSPIRCSATVALGQ